MRKRLALKARMPVQWLRYTATAEEDPYGEATPGYLPPQTLYVYGVAPTQTTELPGPLVTRMADLITFYVPPEFPAVDQRDRFVYRGKTFEVDGGVMWYTDGPFAFTPGGTLNLKAVT